MPLQGRADLVEKYSQLGKRHAHYAAMVAGVDESIGTLMGVLDELGLSQDTLVIFTSDNGGYAGATWCAPLKGAKGSFYEGGIRVPLLIKWPGVVKPGTTSSAPVTSVDYFPTISEVTGLDLPNDRAIDGLSLVKHLRSQGKQKLDRDAIYWHFPHYRHNPGPYSIIREGDWKLIKFYEGPMELFDLKNDLGEARNLASAMPGKVRELEGRLLGHLKSVDAKMPKLNPAAKKLN